ncbi:hypothetical protein ABGB17_33000 [Sphaerisporangium sp. B11E5]|uniref:hypothetical protein n=1 Tax=Sphaerisporangium sp. B11E5 TaxID=3153563 RepID=UPI00325CC203
MSAPLRLGLLGAPGSGKLTFLSALSITGRTLPGYGRWVVRPDVSTTDFMNSAREILTEEKRFPRRGSVPGIRDLLGFTFWKDSTLDFHVEVVNLPGAHFADDREDREAVARNLSSCDGYILLFDPIAERWRKDNHRFLSAMVNRVVALDPGAFPKPLSVCCVKYDDPQVFLPALAGGWGTDQDAEPRFPRVSDAKGFFTWACGHFGDGSGERFRVEVQNFDPGRTAYFVTTSVGFKAERGRFDLDDYVNAQGNRILGEIRPVNVVEPFIALARMTGRTS